MKKIAFLLISLISMSTFAGSFCDTFSKNKHCKYKTNCFGNKIDVYCNKDAICSLNIINYKNKRFHLTNLFLPSSTDISCYDHKLLHIFISTGTNESISQFINLSNFSLSTKFIDVFAVDQQKMMLAYLNPVKYNAITISYIFSNKPQAIIERDFANNLPQLAVDTRTHFDNDNNLVLTYIENQKKDLKTEIIKTDY